jgi:transposase
MPLLRKNNRERAVGIVKAVMTQQAVADHFNVSRITISMLMIRLRQTGRTNDRLRNGSPTSQTTLSKRCDNVTFSFLQRRSTPIYRLPWT